MAFFHLPEEGRYGGLLFRSPPYLHWEFWTRLHAGGVLPLNDDLSTNFRSDAARESLEAMIAATRYLHPETFSADLTRNWRPFGQGQAYANLGWGGTQKFLKQHYADTEKQIHCRATPGLASDQGKTPVS